MALNHFENILLSAIEEELEAYEYYRDLSQTLPGSDVKAVFTALAKEELGHRDQLQGILDKKQFPEFEIQDQFPRKDPAASQRLSMIMKPQDGIALAIRKEDNAMRDYLHMSQLTSDPLLKNLFEKLARMEQSHRERLESILASGSLPDSW